MTRKYSVAEARKDLPTLLDQVEGGQPVEITRRGSPVAVVHSLAEYQRLVHATVPFRDAWQTWRASVDDADLDLPVEWFDRLRDRSTGRAVDL